MLAGTAAIHDRCVSTDPPPSSSVFASATRNFPLHPRLPAHFRRHHPRPLLLPPPLPLHHPIRLYPRPLILPTGPEPGTIRRPHHQLHRPKLQPYATIGVTAPRAHRPLPHQRRRVVVPEQRHEELGGG